MSESQDVRSKDGGQYSDSSAENDSLYSQEFVYQSKDDPAMRQRLANMSKIDLKRVETFRGTKLSKGMIKKFINITIGQAVNPNIIIAISGLCKVFIGEMVEEAKAVQAKRRLTGALLPSHIHEAYRRLAKRSPWMKMYKKEPWNI